MFFGVIAVIALVFVGALGSSWYGQSRDADRPGRGYSNKVIGEEVHPVTVRTPGGVALVDSGKTDAHGQPVMVACATCHDTRKPNPNTNDGAALSQFHKGLNFNHGTQTCLTCHNAGDYNRLKLADGRPLEFSQSMQLCVQCHGPQYRDYKNGSHGGMTGYWDLKQGPRNRHHCTDCHDPHHPAYPKVMPVFPPKPLPGEAVSSAHNPSSH